MENYKLNSKELNILIQEVKTFTFEKFGFEFSDTQISSLIDFVICKTKAHIYDQAASETRYNIQQEFMQLLGITRPPLN